MSERVLVPVTRREPPPGYGAPRYVDHSSDELEWDLVDAEQAASNARRDADRAEEYARARAAVGKALASYRWWGWTNIVTTVRLWIQAQRLRRQR